MKKDKISFWVLVLMIVTAFVLTFIERKWEKDNSVINYDVVSYYTYLPAAFIYDDLTLEFAYHKKENQNFLIWPELLENGTSIVKTTMGVSYLYAPFFFVAHASAEVFGYQADGYSLPYRMMLMLSLVTFFCLSLVVARVFLLRYFKDKVVALTLLGIVAGTNYLHYAIYDIPMSHTYSFFLFSLFLLLTDNWNKKQSFTNSSLVGLVAGLIIMVRPVDVFFLLTFVLWGVLSLKTLKERFLFLLSKIKDIGLIILFGFIPLLPQLIYWKIITGSWIVYSYGEEGFFWTSPHIIDGMFGFRNGWVLYSPTIIFCLIGIYFVKKYCPKLWVSMLVYVPLNLYVVLSWWCWWYTGFGNRAFVNSYAIMTVGLASFLTWAFSQKKSLKTVSISLFTISVGLSLYHTYLYNTGAIHHNGMTRNSYFESLKHGHSTGKYWGWLRIPDHEKASKSSKTSYLDELNNDFGLLVSLENIDSLNKTILSDTGSYSLSGFENLSSTYARSGTRSVSSKEDTLGALTFKFQVFKDEVYKATVYRKSMENSESGVLAAKCHRSDLNMPFTTTSSSTVDGWEKLELMYRVPHELDYENLIFTVYNPDSTKVYFDDFSVERIDGTLIHCDLEKFSEDKRFFMNDDGLLFWDVETVDSTVSFSGRNSVKVNQEHLYSLANEFLVAKGMEIEITIWRKSANQVGVLVLSKADDGAKSVSSSKVIDKIDVWQKIELLYTVPDEFDNSYMKVFVFNPDSADANFDDLEIKFVKNDKNLW